MDYFELIEFLKQYNKGVAQGSKYNQYSSKPTEYKVDTNDVEEFNKIYQIVRNSDMNKLIRTDSGAIKRCVSNNYAYDVGKSNIGVRLTVCAGGYIYVFKVGAFKGKKEANIYPNEAFNKFVDACYDNGIDIEDYKISNGLAVKKEIERPMIEMIYHMKETDKGLTNVHHIDFHNSYPAGLCNTHPEFRKVVEPMYKLRKQDETYKAILNYTIGWMQSYDPSKHRYAEWANLARDAIADNNKRIFDLAFELTISGREVIGYNTDGIWYRGKIYHGDGEGDNLGEWHNDHINCLFRSKSDGAYEFIEDGKYTAVVRGNTSFDAIEPDRNNWHWGDIYKGTLLTFKFDEEKGVIYENI